MTARLTRLTFILFSLLIIGLIITGCGTNAAPQQGSPVPTENTDEGTEIILPELETPDVPEDDSTPTDKSQTEEELVQPEEEEAMRFYVNPRNFMIYPVLEEGETFDDKIVLLTFDDTPTGEATEAILDTLDKYNAKAIFFINGHYAARNLDWLHEIKHRGHIIGNHTWWHIYIRRENAETVRQEIVSVNDFVEDQLGERPIFFRPPFGQNSDVSRAIIKEEGMQSMNWSNGSLDWELKSSEAIVDQVLKNIRSGDNILFHDKQITADALEPILEALTEQGYRFVLPTEVILEDE